MNAIRQCSASRTTTTASRALRAALLLVLTALRLHAQQAPTKVKVDLDVGAGRSFGDGGSTLAGAWNVGTVVAASLRAQANRGPVVAIGGHLLLPFDRGFDCLVSSGSPGCTRTYPNIMTLAALVGWEGGRQRTAGGGRALIGPALMRQRQSTQIGLQARLDATKMYGKRAGLSLWTQGWTRSGQLFVLLSGGVGVRLQ